MLQSNNATKLQSKISNIVTKQQKKNVMLRLSQETARRLHRLSYEYSKSTIVEMALKEFEERYPLVTVTDEGIEDNDI